MDEGFESWDELVKAQANGWTATVILTRGKDVWPWVTGPYATKSEASKASARLRSKFKRDLKLHNMESNTTASFYVRPLWKDEATRTRRTTSG